MTETLQKPTKLVTISVRYITRNGVFAIIIRQAMLKDAQAIIQVLTASQWFTYKNLYSEVYIQNLIHHYYNYRRIVSEILSVDEKWHGYFIAEENGKVLGVIGGGMTENTSAEVYVFYVDPTMHRQGIGTRLLDFYTKIQKFTYGATEQWVAVAKGNYIGIPFYEARGFTFQHEELAYGSSENDQDISLKYKREI